MPASHLATHAIECVGNIFIIRESVAQIEFPNTKFVYLKKMTHSKFGLTPVLLTTTTYYNFLFVKNCSYTLTNLISLLLSAKKHMSFIQNKLAVFYFPTNNKGQLISE